MWEHIEAKTAEHDLRLGGGRYCPLEKRKMKNGVFWIYDEELRLRENKLRETGFDVYCLFSMTGNEIRLAHELNYLNGDCIALPFLRMKRERAAQKSVLVQEALFKGYVFIFVPGGYELSALQRGEKVFRVLDRKENGGLLADKDREYAEWILAQGGILDVSSAIQINDRVRIISGPLLDLEGCIIGFSKRNKNYRIEFEMMGHKVNTWLPYELIEPAGEWRGKEQPGGG